MTDANANEQLVLNAYQFRLPTFEGPLDVLLRLIERDQLAITDVSLIAVTDQFLGYLAQLDERPPNLVAEFAAVGGRLVLLKSRSLLPRPALVTDEPEPEDLVRQLKEYRALRAVSEHLASRDRRALGAFARGEGVAIPAAPPPKLAFHQASLLARALRRRLTNLAAPRQAVAIRPIVSLREMSQRLLSAVLHGKPRFGHFRDTCSSREEVLVGFLSMLILIRRRVLDARQETLFGEITLSLTAAEADGGAHRLAAEGLDDASS